MAGQKVETARRENETKPNDQMACLFIGRAITASRTEKEAAGSNTENYKETGAYLLCSALPTILCFMSHFKDWRGSLPTSPTSYLQNFSTKPYYKWSGEYR